MFVCPRYTTGMAARTYRESGIGSCYRPSCSPQWSQAQMGRGGGMSTCRPAQPAGEGRKQLTVGNRNGNSGRWGGVASTRRVPAHLVAGNAVGPGSGRVNAQNGAGVVSVGKHCSGPGQRRVGAVNVRSRRQTGVSASAAARRTGILTNGRVERICWFTCPNTMNGGRQ